MHTKIEQNSYNYKNPTFLTRKAEIPQAMSDSASVFSAFQPLRASPIVFCVLVLIPHLLFLPMLGIKQAMYLCHNFNDCSLTKGFIDSLVTS